jgi:DNA-directed RNA polymerase subunit RPC12/RpoP
MTIPTSAELDAVRAAGGAVCPDCNRRMLRANGCTIQFMTLLDRRTRVATRYEFARVDHVGRDGRCGDCGATLGHLHHANCDQPSCPRCGGQLLGCLCFFDLVGEDGELVEPDAPDFARMATYDEQMTALDAYLTKVEATIDGKEDCRTGEGGDATSRC